MITIGKSPPGMPEQEIEMYRKIMQEKYPDIKDGTLDIEIDREPDGTEYADLKITENAVPFQRIRRITGYLVGDLKRFNNAKYSEVMDRVKHDFLRSSYN
ncbi:anaerobic ribonucleoside-triphosphate reductase [Ruminococcus flavefaciens]|uniref:anaerobic ribonucleoside-triphosphate reductase n=1 Tax=Ruminococcus flavefaciens TaxID=1265 RepID=UPI0026F05112|nr:anaerobic ribonucleoside-triphosphate reductase [Ruminococcus flavefaciens]